MSVVFAIILPQLVALAADAIGRDKLGHGSRVAVGGVGCASCVGRLVTCVPRGISHEDAVSIARAILERCDHPNGGGALVATAFDPGAPRVTRLSGGGGQVSEQGEVGPTAVIGQPSRLLRLLAGYPVEMVLAGQATVGCRCTNCDSAVARRRVAGLGREVRSEVAGELTRLPVLASGHSPLAEALGSPTLTRAAAEEIATRIVTTMVLCEMVEKGRQAVLELPVRAVSVAPRSDERRWSWVS